MDPKAAKKNKPVVKPDVKCEKSYFYKNVLSTTHYSQ